MFQGRLSETVESQEPVRELSQPRCIACQTALLLALTLLFYGSRSMSRMPEGKGPKALNNKGWIDFNEFAFAFTYKTGILCRTYKLRSITS